MATKITQYVVYGVDTENHDIFMKRVAILLERNNLVDQLAEGVLVSARLDCESTCIDYIKKHKNEEHDIFNAEVFIEGESVGVNYKYKWCRWFDTKEHAERWSQGYCGENYTESSDDNHTFCGEREETGTRYIGKKDFDKAGIIAEYI